MESSSAVADHKAIASTPVPNPFLRRLARNFLSRAAQQVGAIDLGRAAVVFSPHPDDESLGCGGTILKKKQAGASVKLVHVSDGGASTTLIPREELTAMRKRECVNAGSVLGIDDIYFLDFPDGHLWEHIPAAIERVDEILRRESPEQSLCPLFPGTHETGFGPCCCHQHCAGGSPPPAQAGHRLGIPGVVLAPLAVGGIRAKHSTHQTQTYLEEFSFGWVWGARPSGP